MSRQEPVNEAVLQAVLYVGYLGRLCDAVHLFTVQDKFLQDQALDGMALSMILMCGYLGEIISRFTVGPMIDVLGGRNSFLFLCNLSTAVTSAVFASGTSLSFFCVSWLLNSLFMCNTLSAIVRVVSEHVPKERQGRVLGVLGTGNLLGDVFSRFVLGYFVSVGFGWRGIIYVATALNVAMNVPALLYLPASPPTGPSADAGSQSAAALAAPASYQTKAAVRRHKMTSGAEPTSARLRRRDLDRDAGGDPQDSPLSSPRAGVSLQDRAARLWADLIRPIVVQRQFWVLCVMAVALIGTREFFMAFCAPFLTHAYCASSAAAGSMAQCLKSDVAISNGVFASSVFPFIGSFSSVSGGLLKDQRPPEERAGVLLMFLVPLQLSLAALWKLQGALPFSWTLGLVLLVGGSLAGPYSLVRGPFVVDVGGRERSGMAASLIGMAGSSGSMALMWVKAQLDGDWRALFMVLTGICACAVLAAAYLLHMDQEKASRHNAGPAEVAPMALVEEGRQDGSD